jgi:hypothetical protein
MRLWATDCVAEGNILSGFKFVGQYVTAKGLYATGNSCGGFTTGFDTVSYEGSAHVYEGCFAIANGDGVNGGDGWRHQGQVDRITHRDCFAIGNAWSGICLLANSAVKPTDIDICGGSLMNNGQNYTGAAGFAGGTVAGAGFASLSTVGSPNVPSNVRIVGVTVTDTQATKTQQYGLYLNRGDTVYVGEACRLTGNLGQSIYNNAASTNAISVSPQIALADFIARVNTPASVTGTTAQTALQSLTIPANTLGVGQRYRIRARGTIAGTAGTKAVTLTFGAVSAIAISQTAANTYQWWIDATVEIAGAASHAVTYNGYQATTTVAMQPGVMTDTTNVTAAITCSISATLGSAADTVTCSSFYFEPIF